MKDTYVRKLLYSYLAVLIASLSILFLSPAPVAAGDPCDPLEPVQSGSVLGGRPFTEHALPTGVCPSLIASGPGGVMWFKSNLTAQIGKISSSGDVTMFDVEDVGDCLVSGSDGNMWFSDQYNSKIAKITPSGTVTRYDLVTSEVYISSCALGADGNVWFTQNFNEGSNIAKVTPDGAITEYDIIDQQYDYYNAAHATLGPGGNIWFYFSAEDGVSKELLKITTSGTITRYDWTPAEVTPSSLWGEDDRVWFVGENSGVGYVGEISPTGEFTTNSFADEGYTQVRGVAEGADGAAWFTLADVNKIGRMTEDGSVSFYELSSPSSYPFYLTADSDGNIWFGELAYNKIAKISLVADDPDDDNENIVQNTGDGGAVYLVAPEGVTVSNFSALSQSGFAADITDVTYDYPLGLVSFALDGFNAGSTQTVQLIFETSLKPDDVVPRKFNAAINKYLEIPGVNVTQTNKDGKPALLVSYAIADGGELDQDGIANGAIIDPVGLAVEKKDMLANTGTLAVLGMFVGVIMVGLTLYTFRDYRRHKQPLIQADPSVARSYTYWHHLRVVSIPMLRYRLTIRVEKKQTAPSIQ